MPPKVIHYCWFGVLPLPVLAKRCIKSWKKYFPGYELKEWNERNFDVNKIRYTAEAYKRKKLAFVSDYARFDILYKYGGIYFDTDVEVIKPFDNILQNGSFLGMETTGRINPGVGCAFDKGHPVLEEFIDTYKNLDFEDSIKSNQTIVDLVTHIFIYHGFKNIDVIQKIADTTVYPADYFNPIDYDTHYLRITANTLSIHHGAASWVDSSRRITAVVHVLLCRVFGKKAGRFLSVQFRKTAKRIYLIFQKK